MLNEGQNAVARTKVQQVMSIWQHRQKVSGLCVAAEFKF